MNINKLIKDLKNGNNPEEQLGVYSQLLLYSYLRLTYGRFALNFTEKYDLLSEDGGSLVSEVFADVLALARTLGGGAAPDVPEAVRTLEGVRKRVIDALEDMEDYLNYFQVYEHALNRQSYKFADGLTVSDTEKLTGRLMGYITEKNDAQQINGRIQAVLAELPVRMTNTKFFELLERGCLCFAGARNDMADDFFLRMDALAAVPKLESLNASWSELYAMAQDFERVIPEELTKDECRELETKLTPTAQMVAANISDFVDLLELINELYILVIDTPYATRMPEECTKLSAILKAYIKAVDSGDFLDIDADILGGLEQTVKDQEKYLGEHMFMEDALEMVCEKYTDAIDGMMLGGIFKTLTVSKRLFIPSSREDISRIEPYYTVERDALLPRIKKLEETYTRSFKGCGQAMKRCMISRTLDFMPVPLDSLAAVEAFISGSLEGCTEYYERAASEAVLNDLMKAKVI